MLGQRNYLLAKISNLLRAVNQRRAIVGAVVAAGLCVGTTVAMRASAQDPYATKPQTAAPTRSGGGGGSLNFEQLGAALDSFHKNTVDDNGNKYYTVTADTGKIKFDVTISLSPNGHVIWITSDITPMPKSGASASAMVNLLKKNNDIGPMFFSVNGDSLRISDPVPNVNMNAEVVKADLMDLVNTALDCQTLWSQGALGGR